MFGSNNNSFETETADLSDSSKPFLINSADSTNRFLKEDNKKQAEEMEEKQHLFVPTYAHIGIGTDKITETKRDMSVIYGYRFYKSSGSCSSLPGILFPFLSIREHLPENGEDCEGPGYIYKALTKKQYLPKKIWEIIDKPLSDKLKRFGNLETMLISLALSGESWRESFSTCYMLRELYDYLTQEYSDYIQYIKDKNIDFIKKDTYTFNGDEKDSSIAKDLNLALSVHGKYDKSNFPIYDKNMIARISIPLQGLTIKELKNVVLHAVDNYIEINQLRNIQKGDRFFEKLYSHGLGGKKHANDFKEKIEKLFNEGCSPDTMSFQIYTYLKQGHGNSNKTSFKTILIQEFKGILFPEKLSGSCRNS